LTEIKTAIYSKTAKYLNVVVWINNQADRFGNTASIQIGQSKEERESGAKAIYIGNLKEPQSRTNEPTSARTASVEDTLPF